MDILILTLMSYLTIWRRHVERHVEAFYWLFQVLGNLTCRVFYWFRSKIEFFVIFLLVRFMEFVVIFMLPIYVMSWCLVFWIKAELAIWESSVWALCLQNYRSASWNLNIYFRMVIFCISGFIWSCLLFCYWRSHKPGTPVNIL